MKNLKFTLVTTLLIALVGCSESSENTDAEEGPLTDCLKSEATTEANLVKFDTLDFVVYSTQDWKRLHESHGKNIKVIYPDGSVTIGIDDHIKQLSPIFTFAPDTRIMEHPIRFGVTPHTAVTGFIEGTFTEPFINADGTSVAPNNKTFKIPLCTIGIWEDGVMVEEQLFLDNMALLTQIGIIE